MRYSEMFLPTAREVPSDAELVSHQLMIRAGMIRKLTSGVYSWLPLGYRVLRKFEDIVRKEMDRSGAQEVFLPMVQPAELWQESGRWVHYGKELLRFRDRHDREYCLGPTHEEVITDLVRNELKTYRQLPRNLYQIQTKFRDEIRPRFGVMRSREFGMKDAYSFDVDEEGSEISYRKMFEAYRRIFSQCGLNFRPVEADSGSIGGNYSHEFMVMADSGEDTICYCSSCDYAANLEKAEIARPLLNVIDGYVPAMEEVYTPSVRTIEDICEFLAINPSDVVKTLIFSADDLPVAVLVRGDHDVNEAKLKNYLHCSTVELADDDTVRQVTGSGKGFAGAVGIKCRIIADYSLLGMGDIVMGGNREDFHLRHVQPGRDFTLKEFADLCFVKENDPCPRCGAAIKIARGIEVGHVFKLGLKYSKAMKAVFLDKNGNEQFMFMGCYGIGIGRTVAAAVEQNNDKDGIVWPFALSPYHVIITPVNINDKTVADPAELLYGELLDRGVETIFDDRDERVGVKFKDADLIGIPWRITIGAKRMAEGNVEIKFRRTGETKIVPFNKAADFIDAEIKAARLGSIET